VVPGVLLSVRILDVQRTSALWKAIWSALPPDWVRLPLHATFADATGLAEEDIVQVQTPRGLGRLLTMTFIRNSNDIQLVNIVPDERRYDEELTVAERLASTDAFLENCARPLLVAYPDAIVEVL